MFWGMPVCLFVYCLFHIIHTIVQLNNLPHCNYACAHTRTRTHLHRVVILFICCVRFRLFKYNSWNNTHMYMHTNMITVLWCDGCHGISYLLQALQAQACHENMVKVGGYILGEFGNLIAGDSRSRWVSCTIHILFHGTQVIYDRNIHSNLV